MPKILKDFLYRLVFMCFVYWSTKMRICFLNVGGKKGTFLLLAVTKMQGDFEKVVRMGGAVLCKYPMAPWKS